MLIEPVDSCPGKGNFFRDGERLAALKDVDGGAVHVAQEVRAHVGRARPAGSRARPLLLHVPLGGIVARGSQRVPRLLFHQVDRGIPLPDRGAVFAVVLRRLDNSGVAVEAFRIANRRDSPARRELIVGVKHAPQGFRVVDVGTRGHLDFAEQTRHIVERALQVVVGEIEDRRSGHVVVDEGRSHLDAVHDDAAGNACEIEAAGRAQEVVRGRLNPEVRPGVRDSRAGKLRELPGRGEGADARHRFRRPGGNGRDLQLLTAGGNVEADHRALPHARDGAIAVDEQDHHVPESGADVARARGGRHDGRGFGPYRCVVCGR